MKTLLSLLALTSSTFAEDIREWTNDDGQTIRAEFIEADGDNVVLEMNDTHYPIPLASLSQADQDYVADLVAAKAKAQKKAANAPESQPNISLKTHVSGPELSEADVTNRPIILHQWQAHCERCPASLQEFDKLARRKKRYDAAFMVLHSNDKPAMAARKSEELDLDLPVYQGKMIKWDLEKFGEFVWPHLVLISPEGEVVYMGNDDRDLFDKLEEYLK